MRICKRCSTPIKSRRSDAVYCSTICKKLAYQKRVKAWNRKDRAAQLTNSYRKIDRAVGRSFAMRTSFVREIIKLPCSYCGGTENIGLDRIDNSIGHIESNVVPCCGFCNELRGDMPIKAWRHIVPAILSAKSLGLFGSWAPRLTSWLKVWREGKKGGEGRQASLPQRVYSLTR